LPFVSLPLGSQEMVASQKHRGETMLLLGLVKIGGANTQQDRCSELHTGDSHQAAVVGLHPSLYLGR
ncbi:hypothetical protein XENOCAPTIV_028552, partial [Xenoophorus captivus]